MKQIRHVREAKFLIYVSLSFIVIQSLIDAALLLVFMKATLCLRHTLVSH